VPFDRDKADRVLGFVEELYENIGLVLPRYQRELISDLYGTTTEAGKRQYRWCYFSVPRKNAKSTLAAALALYHLCNDGAEAPRVYLAAVNLDQTGETFDIMSRMIAATPLLDENLETRDSENRKEVIRYRDGHKWGSIRALTKGGTGKEGKNPSCVIFDELHQWRESDTSLWAAMTTGSKARTQPQPLFFITTTAGREPTGLCYEKYEYSKRVQSGAHNDPTWLTYIREANEQNWQDEAEQVRANPLVEEGFLPVESLRAELYQALGDPRALNEYKRTQLNIWVGHHDAYLNIQRWKEQTEQVRDTDLVGLPCFAGMDLSRTTDFSSVVLLFIEDLPDGRRKYYAKPFYWLPKDGIHERSVKENQPYKQWAADSLLDLCEGEHIQYQDILAKFQQLRQTYSIREIAYDPYNAEFLVQALDKSGLTLSVFRQGAISFNGPLKDLQRIVNERMLVHGNHPILTWEAGQLVVKEDHNANVTPDKRSRTRKIDGIVALTMALGLATHVLGDTKPPIDLSKAMFG
jgi:phage terminase large subunit-like protein